MAIDSDLYQAPQPSRRPSSIASTSTLTLTPVTGLASPSLSRVPSVVAPKLDLISALARPSRTASASTSTSGDHAFASTSTPSLYSVAGAASAASAAPSSAFDHHLAQYRPRPSSSSTYSFSTTRTNHTEHSRHYPSPSISGQSAEASLLAAKLRLSRSTSLEGSRNDTTSLDVRPGGSSSQRSSFYGTAGSTSYNGSQDFARAVTSDDVFAPGFTRVVHAAENGETLPDLAPGDSSLSARSRSRSGSYGTKGKQPAEPVLVRYVLPYGLSGPAVEKNALNEALLAPAFEVGASEPTLANSLGRSSSGQTATTSARHSVGYVAAQHAAQQMMYAAQGAAGGAGLHPGSMPMNEWMFNGGMGSTVPLAGPNAVPLHLVHGLTSTSSEDYPLDTAELAAYETGLSGNTQNLMGLEHDMDSMNLYQQSHHLVDPSTLRAIALTSQAVAVYRTHTVTRRFRDPFRER
ncbi:hypothetical protein OC842_000059 [Tilletia horrida]|uniref:Uncharacterized protein n=1 Tax=Tilletia horrida TaxID=155126 RepID=A0AAN6JNS0_9BASI|nr:hypothetical protein OC842_000059 [Tilletia horrida]